MLEYMIMMIFCTVVTAPIYDGLYELWENRTNFPSPKKPPLTLKQKKFRMIFAGWLALFIVIGTIFQGHH